MNKKFEVFSQDFNFKEAEEAPDDQLVIKDVYFNVIGYSKQSPENQIKKKPVKKYAQKERQEIEKISKMKEQEILEKSELIQQNNLNNQNPIQYNITINSDEMQKHHIAGINAQNQLQPQQMQLKQQQSLNLGQTLQINNQQSEISQNKQQSSPRLSSNHINNQQQQITNLNNIFEQKTFNNQYEIIQNQNNQYEINQSKNKQHEIIQNKNNFYEITQNQSNLANFNQTNQNQSFYNQSNYNQNNYIERNQFQRSLNKNNYNVGSKSRITSNESSSSEQDLRDRSYWMNSNDDKSSKIVVERSNKSIDNRQTLCSLPVPQQITLTQMGSSKVSSKQSSLQVGATCVQYKKNKKRRNPAKDIIPTSSQNSQQIKQIIQKKLKPFNFGNRSSQSSQNEIDDDVEEDYSTTFTQKYQQKSQINPDQYLLNNSLQLQQQNSNQQQQQQQQQYQQQQYQQNFNQQQQINMNDMQQQQKQQKLQQQQQFQLIQQQQLQQQQLQQQQQQLLLQQQQQQQQQQQYKLNQQLRGQDQIYTTEFKPFSNLFPNQYPNQNNSSDFLTVQQFNESPMSISPQQNKQRLSSSSFSCESDIEDNFNKFQNSNQLNNTNNKQFFSSNKPQQSERDSFINQKNPQFLQKPTSNSNQYLQNSPQMTFNEAQQQHFLTATKIGSNQLSVQQLYSDRKLPSPGSNGSNNSMNFSPGVSGVYPNMSSSMKKTQNY